MVGIKQVKNIYICECGGKSTYGNKKRHSLRRKKNITFCITRVFNPFYQFFFAYIYIIMIPNCQSNVKTKFSRVLAHINLRRILFESYDNLINENKIMVNRIKTQKYIDLLQYVNDQIDTLYIVYEHNYDEECYTGYY
jgi:hypothetical protein